MKEVVYEDGTDSPKEKQAQTHQKKNHDQQYAVPMFAKGELVLRKNIVNKHSLGRKAGSKLARALQSRGNHKQT